MSTDWARVIEGYYRCPIPIPFTVTVSALNAEYSASLSAHPVTITLPSATDTSMHHSDLAAPAWYYSEHATR